MIAIANALDDHIATYNSAAWMRNALKSVPDVSSALVPNMIETLQASRAVQ